MLAAYVNKTEDILLEPEGREITAAVHSRWHSQMLNGLELEQAAKILTDFIVDMKIKNVRKVLADVVNAKVVKE
jgi:hypothetical protein